MTAALANPALDALYRAHGGWLFNWLAAHGHCRTHARDLTQETFCRLAELPALRLHSHPRRYLATVARRLLIDHARRMASERGFLQALALHLGEATAPGPDRVAEAVEQLVMLAEALRELPDRVARAFLLSRVDGLGYAEIGAELGVSTSMVKQYVARAFAHCYVIAHGCPD